MANDFIRLCNKFFPGYVMHKNGLNNSVTEIEARIYNKFIIMELYPGVPGFKTIEPNRSYVSINFFFDPNVAGGYSSSAGEPIPKNLQSNSVAFAKHMLEFTRELKKINIDIRFSATSDDRADSYAKILQKAGYVLTKYMGKKQYWTANTREEPNENPYANKQSFTQRKNVRKTLQNTEYEYE